MDRPQTIVTGATGFIGQHLIPRLLDRGHDVIAIGRDRNRARHHDWYDQIEFVECDYHKEIGVFEPKPGAGLIHLAWQGLPNYKSRFHFEDNLPKNYEFIRYLIQSGVSKVLVTGTCLEYGLQSGPISSETQTKPSNPYAFAKDCLRQYLVYLQDENRFLFQWARLFYMYGKGQNPMSVLAQLDTAIQNGAAVFNMSGGEQLRDYLPVEDVADQIVQLFETDANGQFNICSGEPISIRKLVDNRIRDRNASISLNLGFYPYPDYEPMAFWGKK